jgi:hypothetical protein
MRKAAAQVTAIWKIGTEARMPHKGRFFPEAISSKAVHQISKRYCH